VSRQTSSSSSKSQGAGPIGRSELACPDERPFAEVRKNLNDAWRMLWLHRWMFFIPCCLVASGAFIASLYYPRTYTASTSFERRNDPVMMNLPMSAGAASFKYFRNTMVRDLTSTDCVAEAVEEMGLVELAREPSGELTEQSKRRRDAVARSLSSTLSISTTSPSELIDIIRIAYTGPDPKIGKRLVDQVKATYVRRTMKWIHDFLVSQRDYFQQEAVVALDELQKAQRAETVLRLAHPYVNPTDPSAIALKLTQLESERRELLMRRRDSATELAGHRQLLAQLEPQLQRANTPAVLDAAAAAVSEEILRFQRHINEVNRKIEELHRTRGMTDQHPDIVELLEARKFYENALRAEGWLAPSLATANSPLRSAAPAADAGLPADDRRRETDVARLTIQIAALEAKIKDVDISLETNGRETQQLRQAKDELFTKQDQFAEATGEVGRARQKYNQLEGTVSQIEPAIKAVEQNRLLQFSEGQPAAGGSTPVSPRAVTVILLALAAGIGTGALFVVLAELIDNVFRGSSQVARSLGLPILEAIDEIITAQDRRRLLIHRVVVTPVLIMFCVGLTGLTGSMAYLSIRQPWTYEKLRKVPQTALELFVDEATANQG
jgi:uncharacterized protein involved in exopolysaccharide biosynthesis